MSATPDALSLDDPRGIVDHLRALGWLSPDEDVSSVARAGEGNMNLVARVKTNRRSVIFKQSRPWVEKYPSIAAPGGRLLVEAAFYAAVSAAPDVAGGMPALLAVDEESRSALIEDLGPSSDCTPLYAEATLGLEALVHWLRALHAMPVPDQFVPVLRNREMRALNHAHIFDLPMTGAHGMDLDTITPGLQAAAESFRAQSSVAVEVERLGRLYLADGDVLLHGDFYPGSWLQTDRGLRVIDPEFCFLGPPAFDLGVFLAHLIIARVDAEEAAGLLAAYDQPFERDLAWKFAGVEIMRRLIGVAQLPISRTLEEKSALLDLAGELILEGGPVG
ncbi:MAG: phosphotransferase [Rhodothermales bacterium]|nr:phosphotransferase [Rhodothermales bacterium]